MYLTKLVSDIDSLVIEKEKSSAEVARKSVEDLIFGDERTHLKMKKIDQEIGSENVAGARKKFAKSLKILASRDLAVPPSAESLCGEHVRVAKTVNNTKLGPEGTIFCREKERGILPHLVSISILKLL